MLPNSKKSFKSPTILSLEFSGSRHFIDNMLKNSLIFPILLCILSQVLGYLTPKTITRDVDGNSDEFDIGSFTKVNQKLYYFGPSKVTWFKANLICSSMGGYLASLDNQEDLAELSEYLKANYPTDRWWWLSGSDLDVEGDFYWYRTGERITYADWSAGQPDNAGGKEDCVHLWFRRTKYEMNDWGCTQAAYYICQADNPMSVVLADNILCN